MAKNARSPKVSVLAVLLNEVPVGTITHLPGDSSLFVFDPDYLRDPDRPVLSLSFKTADGGVASSPRPTRTRVTPFFSNLLPEGHLREYLARKGGIHPAREFFLLWLLGNDLPGAVVVKPTDGEELPPHSGSEGGEAEYEEQLLRFSLAGVQLKFSAVLEADGGLTIPTKGVGGDWIVKLPSPRYPAVPEVEYATMRLAEAAGIRVPETRLVKASDLQNVPEEMRTMGHALAVRRFDRPKNGPRVHIEDFAQVFGEFPARKYERASSEDLARVLWAEAGLESVKEFARRLAFAAMMGNADMHLKNWSVRYENGRTAELSPAYDLVPTVGYLPDARMALSMGGTREMQSVDSALFAKFANRAGLPERPVVVAAIETAQQLAAQWKTNEVVQLIPTEIRDKIDQHMKRVPLAKE